MGILGTTAPHGRQILCGAALMLVIFTQQAGGKAHGEAGPSEQRICLSSLPPSGNRRKAQSFSTISCPSRRFSFRLPSFY